MVSLLAPGMNVWVPCPNKVWRAAEIIEVGQKGIKLDIDGREEMIDNSTPVMLRNHEEIGDEGVISLDDLTQLPHLHEPAILHALQLRYDLDKIYTSTGPILIAVNPFKQIAGLYDEKQLDGYLNQVKTLGAFPMPPHVYGIAANAFIGMIKTQVGQMVLISGESGSGKTENTKFVLRLLTNMGNTSGSGLSNIENLVLESNPVMESFGNSCTLRNPNSSRFGKFIELMYATQKEGKHTLVGATVSTYLLEKVRVTEQAEGERNYHIFYQYCAALQQANANGVYTFPPTCTLTEFKKAKEKKTKRPTEKLAQGHKEKTEYQLIPVGSTADYHFTNQSSKRSLKNMDDAKEFEDTIFSMMVCGIDAAEQQSIFRLVGAILLLGNVELREGPPPERRSEVVETKELTACAEALGLPVNNLVRALTWRTIITPTDRLRTPLKVADAIENRDSLARFLYDAVFQRIRDRVNKSFGGDFPSNACSIGVLDIFGFECFEKNSFEQLCINFTNERLQQFFNTYVFKLEEALYHREEIPWEALDFPDNQDIITLIAGKMGIFALLNEECRMPKGSDATFVSKLVREQKDSTRFSTVKLKPTSFQINHFAGKVQYLSDNFLAKNKDQMSIDLIDCVTVSTVPYNKALTTEFLAADLAQTSAAGGAGGRAKPAGKPTVAASFKAQLDGLIQKVDLSEPHFIRCIKPNFHCVPDEFDAVSAVEQLRYGGVLEVLKVQRAGYPVRLSHKECYDSYRHLCLLPRAGNISANDMRQKTAALLEKIDNKYKLPRTKAGLHFTVGKTLAFFKHETYVILERVLYDYRSTFATRISRAVRGYHARRRYAKMKVSIRLLQRCVRGMFGRKIARKARKERDADLERMLREVQARKKREEEELARKLELEKKRQMEEEARRMEEEKKRMAEEQKRRDEEDARRRQKEQEAKQAELLALRQEKLDMLNKLNDFESKVVNQNNEYNKKLEEERIQQQRVMQEKMQQTAKQFEEEKARIALERETEVRKLEEENKEKERQREQEMLDQQLKLKKELEARQEQAKKEMQILQEKQKNEASKFTQDMQKAQLEFERAMEDKSLQAAQMLSQSQRLEEEVRILNEKCNAYRERLAAQEHDFLKQHNQQEAHYKEESELRAETHASRVRDLENEIKCKTAAHQRQMEQLKESYATQLQLQRKAMDDQREFWETQAAEKSQQYEAQLKSSTTMFEQEIAHKQQMFQRLKQENEDQRAAFDQKLNEHLNQIQELTEQTTDMSSASHQIEYYKEKVSYAEKRRNSLQAKMAQRDFEVSNLKLKNSRMNINSVTQFTLGAAAAMKWSLSRKDFDIVVAGGPKCGKSHLLSALFTSHGAPAYVPSDDTPIKELEMPLPKSGSIDGQKKTCKILDCTGDSEHFSSVVSQFSKSHWVICVYDACDSDSIDLAFVLAEQAKRESTVLLFGNMYRSKQGEPLAVEIEQIRERAREAFILALEGDDLSTGANLIFKIMEGEKNDSKSSANDSGKNKPIAKSMPLKPSLKAEKEGIFRAHVINQWEGKRNAVTAIVMGKENANSAHFLMAAGYREGHLAIFRVFRTAMELEMFDPEAREEVMEDTTSPKPKQMLCWQAHDRAITSMMFTPFEDQIVTSSTDLSIRFWNVSNGNLLQVFEDSYAISCVICLPKHPYVFISGNANGILRVGDTEQGVVLQKLKAPVEVRAIVVDSTGLFVFCGTRRGLLLGLECDTPSTMKFLKNLRLQLSQKGIGKITFVPKRANTKPMLLVNSSDSYVSVVELHYNDANHCTNMQVLRRFRNVNNLLPLSSCFAEDASDEHQEKGFVVSASEDKKVYVMNLHGITGNQKLDHPSATIDVAVNKMGTIIASGDAVGNIFLWRRACKN